jgi:GNAT superfamily N-acetyltransferase
MLVAPEHRKQGLGTAFLSFAINHALEKGGRPIIGCGADNIASQRTIESLGYISKHRMLEFVF